MGTNYTQFHIEGRRRASSVEYRQMLARVSYASYNKKTTVLTITEVERDTLSGYGHQLDKETT